METRKENGSVKTLTIFSINSIEGRIENLHD